MSIFKSKEQRARYMNLLGTYYAGLGGLFGAYREARTAFESAKPEKLYARVGIVETDFPAFEDGFLEFQKLRTAMQLAKAEAEAEMRGILTEGGVDLLGIGGKVKKWADIFEMMADQQKEGFKENAEGQ